MSTINPGYLSYVHQLSIYHISYIIYHISYIMHHTSYIIYHIMANLRYPAKNDRFLAGERTRLDNPINTKRLKDYIVPIHPRLT